MKIPLQISPLAENDIQETYEMFSEIRPNLGAQSIEVIAVLHGARDASSWRSRITNYSKSHTVEGDTWIEIVY